MQAQTPKLTITKQQGQNQFYEETLSEVVKLRMMLIPSGTFIMGSPDQELDRTEAESPQHEVTISQFFMGKYPVTQAQWRIVAGMPKVERELKMDPSFYKGDNLPVESVSWYDAVEFCKRLTIHTNREYRLPSEAEWEYACRAGTTTPFHFGETITTDLANYRGIDWEIGGTTYLGFYGSGPRGEYREKTTPVARFGVANNFGLCDMHGNVWEWCADHWYESYEGAPADGSVWLDDANEKKYILRGGSWLDFPRDCRSAYRDGNAPGSDDRYIGFRVCCSSPRTQ
jgi:formylglycine-generating enzyme required for sulfatase activity